MLRVRWRPSYGQPYNGGQAISRDCPEHGGGYVQDFSDRTFEEFFNRYNVNIHGAKYQTYGTSKARKMRAFWEQEPDDLVGRVLAEFLDNYEASCDLNRSRTRHRLTREKPRGCSKAVRKVS